ncbi:MAG: murein biosynthesis integral membrane protein MurJ [Thiobacillaceae bacterium]
MNLLRALATVSSFTLLSRIAGFARDTLVARIFGAGLYTDAFFVALKLPNLLRRLFAEGAFSQAFVPILAEYRNKKGDDVTRRLASQIASLLTLVLVAVALLGVLGAPVLVYVSAPGFADEPAKFDATVLLTRITFPYICFISLVSLSAGILNTWSQFSVPAVTPVLFNLALIFAATVMAPHFHPPILALAWGVLLGGALQLGLQVPALLRIHMFPRPTLNFSEPGVRRILYLMGPATLGVSVAQISLLINTIFASFLGTGSVSWLYYADRLMEFPTGMLGVALGTILLPSLSKHYADKSPEEYSRLLDWGLRLTLMLALPAAAALAVLAVPLISTLFFYGQFTVNDLWMTRQALMAYSLGLLGLILVKVLAPGFYARQNIRTPVKVAIVTLVSTQAMNLLFIGPLRHAGLALSIGLGACLNASLLLRQLRKHQIFLPQPGWLAFMLKVTLAVGAMSVALHFAAGNEEFWLHSRFRSRAAYLLGLVMLGAGVYFLALWIGGIRPRQFSRKAA